MNKNIQNPESIKKFRNWSKINSLNKTNFIIAAIAITAFILISITIPEFLTVQNIINLIVQVSTLGFLAIGVTYVIITGGIDLSVVTVMSASAVVGARVMVNTGSIFLGCLMMTVVGMIFGTINGLAIAKAKMIPFIVTLSTMYIATGFTVWFTNASSISGLPVAFISTIGGQIGNFPVSAMIIIVAAVIAWIILSKTKYGRWIFSTGANEKTARISGIPVNLTKFSTYLFSGFMSGIAAIVLTARLTAATTSMGSNTLLLDVIIATIIGGASLQGGSGSIPGTMLGAFFIAIISNIMNFLGVSYYYTLIIKGMLIVLVIGIDILKSRRQN